MDSKSLATIKQLEELVDQQRRDLTNRLAEQQQKSVTERLDLISDMSATVIQRDSDILLLQDQLTALKTKYETMVGEQARLEKLLEPVLKSYTEIASTSITRNPKEKYAAYKTLLLQLSALRTSTQEQ